MLTNNWYAYFKATFGCANSNNIGMSTPDAITCKGVAVVPVCESNQITYLFPSQVYSLQTVDVYTITLNSKYSGVFFGNGTTAPTKDDYKLSGDIITTLNVISTTPSHKNDGDNVTYTVSYIIGNTGSADITISEVAWFGYGRTTGSGAAFFMYDRTLLDTPVTIAPGGIGKVVYNRSITYPTARS